MGNGPKMKEEFPFTRISITFVTQRAGSERKEINETELDTTQCNLSHDDWCMPWLGPIINHQALSRLFIFEGKTPFDLKCINSFKVKCKSFWPALNGIVFLTQNVQTSWKRVIPRFRLMEKVNKRQWFFVRSQEINSGEIHLSLSF